MGGHKRKGGNGGNGDGGGSRKRGKWFQSNHNGSHQHQQSLTGIEKNSQGIMVTCTKGREARCVEELYRVFEEFTDELYGPVDEAKDDGGDAEPAATEDGGGDIDDVNVDDLEASIQNEIDGLKAAGKTKKRKRFFSVKLDTVCLVFFHTRPPVDPTELVAAICKRTHESGKAITRYTHRLTPIARTGKATIDDIEEVARVVLQPHFHEGQEGIKFAIRPCVRNNQTLGRDEIIKRVASVVGRKHQVDLKNYDVLILVEVYKNVCGMSVVRDFDKYKRFNLVQIHESNVKGTEDKESLNDANGKAETENADTVA